jgi:hypothetical protein
VSSFQRAEGAIMGWRISSMDIALNSAYRAFAEERADYLTLLVLDASITDLRSTGFGFSPMPPNPSILAPELFRSE